MNLKKNRTSSAGKIKSPVETLNKPLKIAWKELVVNRKGILFYAFLMFIFIFWFTTIFNPELFEEMQEFFESYPQWIKDMVGGQFALGEFGGFISTYIFSFAWMYMGIYLLMKSSQDIPKEIDNKTIDLILSKPIKRWEFVSGKYFQHVSTALLITGAVAIALVVGIFVVPNIDMGEVYANEVIFVLIWLFIFLVALVSTGYFFSTFLNTRMALATSFGFMIFFYAIGSFYTMMPEAMQGIRFFSIFYYFRPADMLINHNLTFVWLHALVLVMYSVVLTVIAGFIFNKRDIPV